nr:autotransporter outer membrane beta-barrel domain-containing protein [Natronocella acetinitrilica]
MHGARIRTAWLAVAGLTVWVGTLSPLEARRLAAEIDFYLGDDCAAMGFERDANNQVPPEQAGPNLAAYCSLPPPPPPPDPGAPPGIIVPPDPTPTFSAPGTGATSNRIGRRAGSELRRRAPPPEDEEEQDNGMALHWRQLDRALGGGSSEFYLEGQTPWSAYLTLEREREEQQQTRLEDGHDSRGQAVLIGADRWLSANVLLGIAADIRRVEGSPRNGGDFTIDSQGLTLYGSFLPDQRGTFIDLSLGVSRQDMEQRRRTLREIIEGDPDSDPQIDIPPTVVRGTTDGSSVHAALGVGTDFTSGRYVVGPRASLQLRRTRMDAYRERGETPLTLTYDDRTQQSVQSMIGLYASAAFSLPKAVLVPQLEVNWIHEFRDDQQTLTARFAEDRRDDPVILRYNDQPPDRDYYLAQVAVTAVLPYGISAFAALRTTFRHDYLRQRSAAIGLRAEF